MNFKETPVSSKEIYQGKILRLRLDEARLPNGTIAPREVIEHPGGVCVAPLTAEGDLLLVRQFRYPYSEETLEIPAGKRDRQNEEPLLCGQRELREETGATAENYTFLGQLYPSPGYFNEIIWMYAATGLSYGEQDPDDDEFVAVERYPLDRAVEMVLSGEIKDAKTQAAILKVKLLHDAGKL